MTTENKTGKIGLLNEKPLHMALKKWYAQPDDLFEVPVDGYVIDIVRGNLLVEIQTGNFSSMKRKLKKLIDSHPIHLVYPIASEKFIVKLEKKDNTKLNRRKSPKRGCIEHIFEELVSFPQLLCNPNFSLEVLFIFEDEIRVYDGKKGWRKRGWITHERHLLNVVENRIFRTPIDMLSVIPANIPEPFTTSDLAKNISKPLRLAQKITYCLKKMNALKSVGKKGNSILYSRVSADLDYSP